MNVLLTESQVDLLFEEVFKDVKEDIFLKKDPKNQKLIIFSDKETPKERNNETYFLKDKFKQLGFKWNDDNYPNTWSGDFSKLDDINKVIKAHNKTRILIDKLEELEDFVESDPSIPTSKKDELKSKIDLYINDLANATDQAAMDAAIRNYLTFNSKFHNYSFYNTMLIWIQKPDASKVAGFKSWKTKFNRGVKKGAKSIYIWVPMFGKKTDTTKVGPDSTDVTTDDSNEKVMKGFRVGHVFDISDTYPLNEKGEIPAVPQWWEENTPNETAEILLIKIKEVVDDLKIKLTKDPARKGEKGYSAGGHINISSDVEGVTEAGTLIHELAHELLHHKNSPFYSEDFSTSERQEIQAESVSYVVLKHYNLPVNHHPTYLALWKATKQKIMNNLDVINKCSNYIINKIDGVQVEDSSQDSDVD